MASIIFSALLSLTISLVGSVAVPKEIVEDATAAFCSFSKFTQGVPLIRTGTEYH